jgi:N-dimethylarginine dimethylaminohydrolase
MTYTCQSETGKLKSLFIKRVSEAFINQDRISREWKNLNYLGMPVFEKAIEEYENFEHILQEKVPEIYYLPANNKVNMDSMYCRDAAIGTDSGMIICQMGKTGRINEPAAEKEAFYTNHIPVLGEIRYPGTLEGGDVAWLDENTLAIGHTYRTNKEGIQQAKVLLDPLGIEIITVDLPHYKGPSDVFHLMSILSPVDKNLAVVYSPLMPVAFRQLLLERGYQLIEVPDEEFESMGCNILAMAPRDCLMVSGNPFTRTALEKAGCQVTVYPGIEISLKGGGGPTCLTRPILRNSAQIT